MIHTTISRVKIIHPLKGILLELGEISGSGEGQRGLACSSPRGRKDSDMPGQLNNSNRTWAGFWNGWQSSVSCCGLWLKVCAPNNDSLSQVFVFVGFLFYFFFKLEDKCFQFRSVQSLSCV